MKSWLSILILFAASFSALAAPVTLELLGGSVVRGEMISWDGKQAVVKAEFGTMTFRRDQLTPATVERIELASGNPEKLLAKISELEATIAKLRQENADLQLRLQTAAVVPRGVAPTAPATTALSQSLNSAPVAASYTISSTGKRHNSHCRYYGVGRPCGPNDGVACKICGG